MANETLLSNLVTIGNAVSAEMSAAFVQNTVGLSLVHAEAFPDNTNVIKFAKSGSLIAETVAEATNYTYSSNSQLQDTSVSCTAKKSTLGTKITVEAARFGNNSARLDRIAAEHGRAHARLFDSDLRALFSTLTNGVTATSTMTKDVLLDSRYQIEKSAQGAFSGRVVGLFDFKAVDELRKEVTSITAEAFGNMEMLGLLGQPKAGNGYAGDFLGVSMFQQGGMSTSGANNVQAIWDPTIAFAAGVDGRDGLNNSLKDPSAINGLSTEIQTWTFFKVIIWNDTAACKVLSAT